VDPEDRSFELFSHVTDPDPDSNAFRLLIAYDALRRARGEEAAVTWLRGQMTPALGPGLGMEAYRSGHESLLWSLPLQTDERVWVLRQAMMLRRIDTDPEHERLLAEHFALPVDSYLHQVGRYLRGAIREEELLVLGEGRDRACTVAYFLGLRAQAEGRYSDALLWYRAAIETGIGEQPEFGLAVKQIESWRASGMSLSRLQALRK
jgi:hypothetical protein